MRRLAAGLSNRLENLAREKPTPYGMRPGFGGGAGRHCEWIESADARAAIRAGIDPHCGAPTIPRKAYCAKHLRQARGG